MYEGEAIEILSTYKVDLQLEDGNYTAQIHASTYKGRDIIFDNYPIIVDGTSSLKPFTMFGTEHLVTMAVLLLLGIFIIKFFMDKPIGRK